MHTPVTAVQGEVGEVLLVGQLVQPGGQSPGKPELTHGSVVSRAAAAD